MKAGAVFPGQRRAEVVALDEPKLSSPNQVKLRMLEVGVCGTDREICHFRYGTPPEGFEFLVLGHESLGEVVETGSAVTRGKARARHHSPVSLNNMLRAPASALSSRRQTRRAN